VHLELQIFSGRQFIKKITDSKSNLEKAQGKKCRPGRK
jgi:hypothetical protein